MDTVWALDFWASDFWATGFWTNADAPEPEPEPEFVQQTGGRARHARRRPPIVVEIDGQYFQARDQAHAIEILKYARVLAERAAQTRADDIVERATPKVLAARVVRRVDIKAPALRVPPELKAQAEATRVAIERAYSSASVAAELRLLLALQEAEDEEDAVFLLM